MHSKYRVIVEAVAHDVVEDHELTAAIIIAHHFKSDVVFLKPGNYTTPDFIIGDIKWELKSPVGKSRRTIENNMRAARRQSENIIIDLRRIKIPQRRALSHVRFFLSKSSKYKRLLVITKNKKVIVII